MISAQIKAEADAIRGALQAAFIGKQEAYYAAHGEYWQGLISHTEQAKPVDGAKAVPDNTDAAPSDRPGRTWNYINQTFGDPIVLPELVCTIQVNVLGDSPETHAFQTVYRLEAGGEVEVKADIHPDDSYPGLAHDWTPVE